jgi:MFS family permease
VLGGAFLIAAGLVSLGSVHELWQFCLVYGLLGITAGMTGIVPLTTLVFRWFADQRGLAMGVASSGTLGGLFLSSLAYLLIERLGWRRAYLLLGLGAGFLLFATVLATVRDTPEASARGNETGTDPGQAEEKLPERNSGYGDLTLKEAFRTQPFWLLSTSGFLFLGALAGVLAHAVPLALDRGLARGVAAFSLGLIIGLGPVGKVSFGHLADRYQARKILVATFVLQGLAILLVLGGEGAAVFWSFVILFAVGQGGALTVAPLVLGNLFGSSSLGSVVGGYWLIATGGSLVGPPLAAVLREHSGSYFPVLVVFASSMFCAALLTGMIHQRESPSGR